jgi:hypothetical protein
VLLLDFCKFSPIALIKDEEQVEGQGAGGIVDPALSSRMRSRWKDKEQVE